MGHFDQAARYTAKIDAPAFLRWLLPGLEPALPFHPLVRTLRDDDAAATLAGIEAGSIGRCVLPWIPLMHGGGDADTMEAWKRVAGLEPDSRLRSVYGSLALVFAELADRKDA